MPPHGSSPRSPAPLRCTLRTASPTSSSSSPTTTAGMRWARSRKSMGKRPATHGSKPRTWTVSRLAACASATPSSPTRSARPVAPDFSPANTPTSTASWTTAHPFLKTRSPTPPCCATPVTAPPTSANGTWATRPDRAPDSNTPPVSSVRASIRIVRSKSTA